MEENNELETVTIKRKKTNSKQGPTVAYSTASWISLCVGFVSYNIGLYNADIWLSEKGYYFTILLFGLFSVASLQKSVRDKQDGLPVTSLFYALGWAGTLISIILLIIGLYNAEMLLSEKGFYAMSFILTLFATITVQKNIRDIADANR